MLGEHLSDLQGQFVTTGYRYNTGDTVIVRMEHIGDRFRRFFLRMLEDDAHRIELCQTD
jgi:hypothetical protein